MSFRGLWVLDEGAADRVLFSRRFPTVEKRARAAAAAVGSGNSTDDGASSGRVLPAVPPDPEWAELVLAACNGRQAGGQPVGCDDCSQPPVYLVGGQHWPVVVLERVRCLYVYTPSGASLSTVFPADTNDAPPPSFPSPFSVRKCRVPFIVAALMAFRVVLRAQIRCPHAIFAQSPFCFVCLPLREWGTEPADPEDIGLLGQ